MINFAYPFFTKCNHVYKGHELLITTIQMAGNISLRLIASLTLLCMAAPQIIAQELVNDSIGKKPNLISRILQYFDDSNKEHPEKKIDFTFLGGPSYSASTSIQLAVIAAGLYHTKRDSVTPESNISVFAQGSITGFYRVGVFGNHFFPGDRFRINYHADFAHFPLKFWGIGYDMESQKSNESGYTELQSVLLGEFLWRLPEHMFLGPSVNFNYGKATKVERPELWNGEDLRVFNYGMGIVFSYDTREYPTNATKGWNITFKQKFFPRFIGNNYAFSSTELNVGWYKQFWDSGTLAFQLHGHSTYGNTPWSMLPTVDASHAIRGYYEGRYRDKNEADFVVELRQHIWRRNGIVVWGGVGTVFDSPKEITYRRLLPSYGIGYRWEFKKRVNVRIDLGFGKESMAFVLGLHETF